MEREEEEIERNINNITCDTSFRSPITVNVKNKYAKFSLERRLVSGNLVEIIEIFKGCNIQSTISNSALRDSNKQFHEINDSDEQVDTRNWLRNDSAE